MRKIDIQDFQRATRDTPREVNRRIILTLLREHEPISRADLARSMDVPRSMITSLVNELLEEELVIEGGVAATSRGRRPTLLHLRSHDRLAIGVDVRTSLTLLQLSDFSGKELARESFPTDREPVDFARRLGEQVEELVSRGDRREDCEGIGIVVPGMVDAGAGRILNAPTLGWQDVDLMGLLPSDLGLPVHMERDAVACAMAQLWLPGRVPMGERNFVYVIVSEGVGTGLIVNGQPVRGKHFTAGEFGHLEIGTDGPYCSCGSRGCLEAYASDFTTVARYLGMDLTSRRRAEEVQASGVDVEDVVQKARSGDAAAQAALRETAEYLGIGFAAIIKALDPGAIVVGGEIARGWDMVRDIVVDAVEQRSLTPGAPPTPLLVDTTPKETRLLGATALVVAPAFAAPKIA